MKIDSITLEVFKHRFASVAEEMGVTLCRTAFSPNIKERRDFSCAVFNDRGELIAQASHIPVHLGSMAMSVQSAIDGPRLCEGDMVMLNDPFRGGTHLPDITVVAPVYAGAQHPRFYVANRAHHADIGGVSPGSMPLSTSLYEEGLIIPPVRIIRDHEPDAALLELILNNVRTPEERKGDLASQWMANRTGIRRLEAMLERFGHETCRDVAKALMDYSETLVSRMIATLPHGTYTFTDHLDDDGHGTEDIAITLDLTIEDERLVFDFSRSDDQTRGNVNAVKAITASAVLYVVNALLEGKAPMNDGVNRRVFVKTRAGSVLDATFPAAVAAGNVETSQRLVDVALGALAQAVEEKIPAASQGTMNNVTMGGYDPVKNRHFTYYETIGGGMGASPSADGSDARHSHMTNTLNTPIEALEFSYPLKVTRYALREGSGGRGEYCGGEGIIREIEALVETTVSILGERRRRPPYGLCGGAPGACGVNTVLTRKGQRSWPGKFQGTLLPGERLRIETPGGGGFGKGT